MFVSCQKFLWFYIPFLLLAVIERINDTFFHKKIKPTLALYHSWAFTVLFYGYIFIVIFSIGEFFLYLKEISLLISILGSAIYGSGVFLRRKAIDTLGENWSVYIDIKEGHELITNGVYGIFRHPYCLAVFLELVGISLIANAFFSLFLVFFVQVPLLMVRIVLEEKVLITHFGDLYRDYIGRRRG